MRHSWHLGLLLWASKPWKIFCQRPCTVLTGGFALRRPSKNKGFHPFAVAGIRRNVQQQVQGGETPASLIPVDIPLEAYLSKLSQQTALCFSQALPCLWTLLMDLCIQHIENQTPQRDLHALVEIGDPTLQFSSAMFWSTSLLSSPIFTVKIIWTAWSVIWDFSFLYCQTQLCQQLYLFCPFLYI